MSEIEDGNLLHRGGLSAWQTVKEESKNSPSHLLKKKNCLMNYKAMIGFLTQRHLSPGGSADLLALGIYFAQLEEIL